MFKHAPPKKSDLMDSLASRSGITLNTDQNQSLKEFSPVYSREWRSTDVTQKGNESSSKSLLFHTSFNSVFDGTTSSSEKATAERGLWCISASAAKKTSTAPLRKLSGKEIQRIKSQYNVSDHTRGKWIITRDCCCTAVKMSGAWREVCKMLKCGRLPYCNAKYQVQYECEGIDNYNNCYHWVCE